MQQTFQRCLLISAAAALSVLLAYAQDSPSMGDVARQARQQKQSKDAQSKAAPASKSSKVITNDEIPESPEAADGASTSQDEGPAETSAPSTSGGPKQSAEQWKSQILAQKATVSRCKVTLTSLMTRSSLLPATASRAVCSGTSGKSRNSRKSSECGRNWKRKRNACRACRNPPASKATAGPSTIRRSESGIA